MDISSENQKIFEKIYFQRHRKLKPLDLSQLHTQCLASQAVSCQNQRRKTRRYHTHEKENISRDDCF